jgi:hypothetical protein
MKNKKPLRIENTSILRRNLARHPMPPPSFSFTDKKKREDQAKCRKKTRSREEE